jgi:hypothetical protein
MKHPHIPFIPLFIGVIATAGMAYAQHPTVMTPPAVPDGSNWSRAPLPAARPLDDMKAPDGQAIDQLPPNTPATNIEAPIPPARVAILQPAGAPAPAAYAATTTITTTTTEPALAPTGRTTTTVVAPAAAPAVEIRPARQPVIEMTRPAVPDGSNWSRAPLPAKRELDDMKRPDGQAIDQLPVPPPVIER